MRIRRGRCNRCSLEDVQRLADVAEGFVEIRPRGHALPAGLAGQEQYSGPLGVGYDLFIVYADGPAWAMWLSGLETSCTCGLAQAAMG